LAGLSLSNTSKLSASPTFNPSLLAPIPTSPHPFQLTLPPGSAPTSPALRHKPLLDTKHSATTHMSGHNHNHSHS
jgi:hypothetical protein